MQMEMDVERRNNNIIALHGSRIPQVLGTFQLDDHNVQEWSDFNQAGMKHRARKEIGTWIDRDRNADIMFQRHEDSKRSDRSREQQRTEVIQGNAPDAQFQIIRSSRQFQDSDNKSGARMTSMSTSYQVSSTRGIRTTSKTTSNKTSTKTVTVSGGRSDDFENLKMSFQPLDTSTQRERINMSRSGTMGVRRPPTRRHTPAAAPAPQNLQQSQEEQEDSEKLNDGTSGSILGLKNISPKIRVGFPVEIQLELQSKLRYSNGDEEEEENGAIINEEDEEEDDRKDPHEEDTGVTVTEIKEDEGIKLLSNQSSTTWHAQEQRAFQNEREASNLFNSNSDDVIKRLATNIRRLSPSPSLSRSWDLIQSVAKREEDQREERSKIFLSSPHLDQWKAKAPPQRSFTNLNPFEDEFPPQQDSLESPRRSPERSNTALYGSDEHFPPTFQITNRPLHKVGSTPDIIHHNGQLFQATPHKSRLMSLLNETPDLLNKMAFTSHHHNNNISKNKSETFNKNELVFGKTNQVETKNSDDQDGTDRFLDSTKSTDRFLDSTKSTDRFLDSTKSTDRFLDSTKSTDESFTLGPASVKTPKILRGDQLLEESILDDEGEEGYRSGRTQVSHTWISASDKEKPSQRVRDKDVTTSISATSDPYRKLPKKVEFSKTEVHFTPDSGKFHIVETDENKPSTVHLFRRKKRKTSKEEKKLEILSKVLTENKSQKIHFESKNVDIEKTGAFTSERCDEELGIDEQTVTPTRINKDSKISQLYEADDIDSKFESEVDSEDDDAQSDDIATLSNYGELKIQRYLKQLKFNNNSDRLSPERAELEDDDELGQFRYDSAYENGSFVPLATRRSLIEMNNRNRTKNKTSSRISDNSSTTSNYSLPMSDAKADDYSPTLKLKTLEAIVDTSSTKPQITSIDLRYGFPTDDSYFDGTGKRNFSRQEEQDDATDVYHVGEPVKPEIKSLPPFRSSKYFAQFDDDDDDDAEEESKLRPPMPILPSKFSSFEKTGAALRERFNAKTTVRPKPEGREAPLVFLDGANKNSNYIDGNVTNSSYIDGNSNFDGNLGNNLSYIPSKSVVNIGGDGSDLGGKVKIRIDRSEQEDAEHRRMDRDFDDTSSPFQEISGKDPISHHQHVPEPILSMDHTWKGPAHFDNQIQAAGRLSDRATTSVARSLTFPKSSRPEPEWVAKAKSRESRVKDWNLVGKPQQYVGAGRKAEPPWVTEIRFKSKLGGRTSPGSDTKSLLVNSIVYPWEKDDKGGELFENSRHSEGLRRQDVFRQVETPRHHEVPDRQHDSTRHHEVPIRNNESTRHHDVHNRHHESTRHHEVPIRQQEGTRHHELPNLHHESTRHHELPGHPEVPTRHHEVPNRHHESTRHPEVPTRHHEPPEPQVRVQSPEIIVPIRKEPNVTITELADDEPEMTPHEFVQKDSLDSEMMDNDDDDENVEKLLGPILEQSSSSSSSKRGRKPLQISGQNRANFVLEKPRAPPRPPKPPQRISSLTNKSAALAPAPPPLPPTLEKRVHLPGPSPPPVTKRHHPAEKRSRERLSVPSPSSLERRSVSGSPSSEKRSLTPQKSRRSSSYNQSSSSSNTNHNATNNNRSNHPHVTSHGGELLVNKTKSTPIHNHPLVKVAKIPSAARPSSNSSTAKALPSSDGKGSKNKAKHQVVTTTETKIACKSKLMDGQPGSSGVVKDTTEAHSRMADPSHNNNNNNCRPLPKVPPPPPAPQLVSPHRNR